MLIFNGIYKFFKKQIGYREGWCKTCQDITFSEKIQTWNFFHLFWIPIIPLGKYKYLICKSCNDDPNKDTRESAFLLIIGSIIFPLMLIFLFIYDAKGSDQATMHWAKIFIAIMSVLCIYMAYKRISSKDKKAVNYEYKDNKCYYCTNELVSINNNLYCENCKLYRLT